MPEFVSVLQENGRVVSLSADYVAGLGDAVKVLDDEPATNANGDPLPERRRNGRRAKAKTTVSKEVAKKAANQTSDPGPSDTPTSDGTAVEPEEAK